MFRISKRDDKQVVKLFLACDDNIDIFFNNEYEILAAFKDGLQ